MEMMEMDSLRDRRFLSALVFSLTLICVGHGAVLMGLFGVKIWCAEGSDAFFYSSGARSIVEFDIAKKFNNKRYPIVAQKRPIVESDMPSYAKYVLAPYPNPSFKFGFSLVMAVLTAPFSDAFLDRTLQQPIMANFILTLLTIGLMGAIFWIATGNWLAVIVPTVFWVFDPFFIYNNYYYACHTVCGLFFVLAAVLVYFRTPRMTFTRMALISFLLIGSVLSSSHEVLMAFFFGLSGFVSEVFPASPRRKVEIAAGAAAGLMVPLGYIVGVEWWFEFRRLGIPGYFEQFSGYSSAVGRLIKTYPLTQRFLWDWRTDNTFVIPILVLTCIVIFTGFRKQRAQSDSKEATGSSRFSPQNIKLMVVGISMCLAFLSNAFYTQPISRGATPYILIFWAFIGWVLSRALRGRRMLSWAAFATILVLLVGNYLITFKFMGLPFEKTFSHEYEINESEPILVNSSYFYSKHEVKHVPFNDISDSLETFVSKHLPLLKEHSDLMVSFDAMLLSEAYSWTRRFIPAFVFTPDQVVNQATVLDDFRLISEIFRLHQDGVLPKDTIVRDSWRTWPVGTWDREYSYIYGYEGRIKQYLVGTPLQNIDTRSMYYFKFANLVSYVDRESRQLH